MGTDLFALKKTDNTVVDSYQIWKCWRDSDVNTWPKCLQYFWWHIHDHESAQECAKNIREWCPFDKELIRFAIWLEQFDHDIFFELSM
jgi:hypothetical protein